MASPAVAGSAETSFATAVTAFTSNLPASIASGDLLLAFIARNPARTVNAITGWSEVSDDGVSSSVSVLARTSDGTDSGTVPFVLNNTGKGAVIILRITGAANVSTLPTISTVEAGAATTTPGAPNCDPAVSKDYLWVAALVQATEEIDDDTWANSPPSSYGPSPPLQATSTDAGLATSNCTLAVAYRQLTASSEDPGTFSVDTSAAYRSYTVAVHPFTASTLTRSAAIAATGAIASAGTVVSAGPATLTRSAALSATAAISSAPEVPPEPPPTVFTPRQPAESVSLAAEIELSNGITLRFSPDEADLQVPVSAEFSTEVPGGFSAAGMTIPRSGLDATQVLYGSVRMSIYESAETIYEGRITGVNDSGTDLTLELEGWAKHLEDDQSARMIWYDRDLSSWGEASVQRRLDLVGTYQLTDASVVPDKTTGEPSLETGFSLEAARASDSSGWYDAGGLPIAEIDWAWKKSSTVDHADTDWTWGLLLSTDDILTSINSISEQRGAGPACGTLTASSTTKLFAMARLRINDTTHTTGTQYSVFWTLLGVVGDHGLTLAGSVSAPNTGRGLFPHQIIEYAVENWAPLLTIGEIETTDFVIPHAVDKEPTTAGEMIEKYALFGGSTSDYPIDWWVYEDKTFGAGTSGNYGTVWRARLDEGAEARGAGPDVGRLLNGVYVKYNDGVGDRSVGPPSSGADIEDAALEDTSESNLANRDGARHWQVFDAGVTSDSGAIRIGQVVLAERNRQEWRGDVTLRSTVRAASGELVSVARVRAGDRLVIEDDPDMDFRERRIVSTQYNSASDELACSVGARPDRLDALLARLGVVLEGRLS